MITGVGVDIEAVARFREQLGNEHFLQMIFTEKEIDYCSAKNDPAQSFAGRFCAKEAVIKAWLTPIGMKEIEVLQNLNGKLDVFIHGSKKSIHCSISHTEEYAMAMVVVEQEER